MADNRQNRPGIRRPTLPEAGEAKYISRDLSNPPRSEAVRSAKPSKAAAMIAKRKKEKEKKRNFLIGVAALLLFLVLTVGVIVSVIHRAAERAKETETGTDTAETSVVTEPRATEPIAAPVTEPEETEPEETLPPADGRKVVCIDPGHGFYDHGTSSELTNGTYEMDITLGIGLMLRDKLEAAGYTVIMTHDTNECPANNPTYLFNATKRLEYLGTLKGVDVFVSIHCNSYNDVTVSGPRIYYDDQNGKNTPKYAEAIKAGLTEVFPDGKEPQIYPQPHASAFLVTKHSYFPAILLETGFVTNETDAKNMLDPAWRDKMAQAIAKGISDFLSE